MWQNKHVFKNVSVTVSGLFQDDKIYVHVRTVHVIVSFWQYISIV